MADRRSVGPPTVGLLAVAAHIGRRRLRPAAAASWFGTYRVRGITGYQPGLATERGDQAVVGLATPIAPSTFRVPARSRWPTTHGYAIASRARELSDDRLNSPPEPSTGLSIDSSTRSSSWWTARSRSKGCADRYYRISEAGREAPLTEVEQMRSSVAAAEGLIEFTGAEVTP